MTPSELAQMRAKERRDAKRRKDALERRNRQRHKILTQGKGA